MATRVKSSQILDGTIVGSDLHSAVVINTTAAGTFGSVIVDNFTLDGTTLALSSGNMTLDSVAGDIVLDAHGNQILFKGSSGQIGFIDLATGRMDIKASNADADMRFQGNDGGVAINALTLDMSAAGAATFNAGINVDGTITGVTDFNSSGDMIVGGDLSVTGDLTVQGTQVTLNTTALDVEDKNITLNYHASNDTSASADGAGITIQDAVNASTNASILWNATNDAFDFSHEITAPSALTLTSSAPRIYLYESDTTDLNTALFSSGGAFTIRTTTDNDSTRTPRLQVSHSTGDISFYNTGGNAVKMFWDASGESLSIGTTGSGTDRRFQISGTGTSTSTTQYGIVANPTMSNNVTGSIYNIYSQANVASGATLTNLYSVYIGTNGLNSSTVTNNYGLYQAGASEKNYFAGNVGIGTSTPQHKLDTVGTIRHTSNIVSNTVYKAFSIGSDRSINDYGGVNKDYWAIQLATPGASTDGQSSAHAYGSLKFSGVSGSDATLDDVLVLKYNGYVGIGTPSPDALLHISATSPHIDIGPQGGNRGKIGYHSNDVIIGSTSSTGNIIFKNNISSTDSPQTSGDVKMTIADVGLTIHSDTYNILNLQTDSNNDETSTDGIIKITNNNGSSNVTKAEFRWDESEDLVHVSYGDHGRHISINSSGNVGIGTGSVSPVHTLDVDGAIATSQVRHSVRPTLNLDFANSKELDSRITFYRDSIATYYDSKGTLRYANVNEPRFDHDPATGESKGLLIEESRTNTFTYSNNPERWPLMSNSSSDPDASGAISPDGTANATKLVATGSDPYFYQNNLTLNGTYTFSYWIKGFGSTVGKHYTARMVNVSTNQTTAGTIPAEWTRYSHTFTTGNTTTAYIGIEAPDSSPADGDTFSIWGAQLEYGSFVTSLIPSDTRFTSRSSVATYYDENGILRTAPANGARYGYKYDGRKWVETGLILEEASTNLLYNNPKGSDLYGDVMGAEAIWTITDSSIDVTAPDGSSKTTKGVSGTTGNSFFWTTGAPVTYVNGNFYTHSVWMRTATGTTATLQTSVYPQIAVTGGHGPSVTVTDQWQRFPVTFKFNSSLAKPYLAVVSPQHSKTFYFWGWQVEQKATATSYIKTVGSAVTRAADVASSVAYTRRGDNAYIDGKDFEDFYNPNEGTIHLDYQLGVKLAQMRVASFAKHGTNTDFIDIIAGWGTAGATTGGIYMFGPNSTGSGINTAGSTITNVAHQRRKFAGRISHNDFYSVTQNSTTIAQAGDTDAGIPILDRLNFGDHALTDSQKLCGHIRKVVYYPEGLTNAELIALTENN